MNQTHFGISVSYPHKLRNLCLATKKDLKASLLFLPLYMYISLSLLLSLFSFCLPLSLCLFISQEIILTFSLHQHMVKNVEIKKKIFMFLCLRPQVNMMLKFNCKMKFRSICGIIMYSTFACFDCSDFRNVNII